MVGAGDDAERSDEEERRRWLAPATMQSAAMRRSGAAREIQRRRDAYIRPGGGLRVADIPYGRDYPDPIWSCSGDPASA